VIDKLTENVEMVAWLIRVAARRRARRIHCFRPLEISHRILSAVRRKVPRGSFATNRTQWRARALHNRFARKELARAGTMSPRLRS
jgi:hypothetical protein